MGARMPLVDPTERESPLPAATASGRVLNGQQPREHRRKEHEVRRQVASHGYLAALR